jgi:hypothetical protein
MTRSHELQINEIKDLVRCSGHKNNGPVYKPRLIVNN